MADTERGGNQNVNDWKQASDDMINNNDDIKFMGVYSLHSKALIAASGSNRINITENDIEAIITHTGSSDNVIAGIKIAGLNFACLSYGYNRMTGMSNFNMDDKEMSEVDKVLYEIAKIRYTRQASFEAQHMLKISAFIHDDVLLIGIAVCGENTSVLQILEETVRYKEEGVLPKKKVKAPAFRPLSLIKKSISNVIQKQDTKHDTDPDKSNTQTSTSIPIVDDGTGQGTKPTEVIEMKEWEVTDVKRRASTKAEIERRKDSARRGTEFCEDWRTATVRSIEALRNIGPFSGGTVVEDDTKPLILSESGYHTDKDTERRNSTARRSSRPTMV